MNRLKAPLNAFFVAVAGGVAGAAVVVLASAISRIAKIDAGEWLQSISTVIGVGLTIFGALWLEERKRRRDRAEEKVLVEEALLLLKTVIEKVVNPGDDDAEVQLRLIRTISHHELIRQARESLAYARAGFRIRNFGLWSALNALDNEIAAASDTLVHEEGLLRGRGVTEHVLRISRERLSHIAEGLRQPVESALDALSRDRS